MSRSGFEYGGMIGTQLLNSSHWLNQLSKCQTVWRCPTMTSTIRTGWEFPVEVAGCWSYPFGQKTEGIQVQDPKLLYQRSCETDTLLEANQPARARHHAAWCKMYTSVSQCFGANETVYISWELWRFYVAIWGHLQVYVHSFFISTTVQSSELREFSMPLASVRYHAADSCGFKPCQGDDKPKEQQGATFFLSISFQNLLIQDLDLVAWFSYFVWHRVLSVTFITSVRPLASSTNDTIQYNSNP